MARRSLFTRGWIWVGGFTLLAAAMVGGGVKNYWQRQVQVKELRHAIAKAESRLKEKEALLARARTDHRFLEKEARRQLGLLRPGEVEYRFGSDIPLDGGATNPF